MRNSDCMVHADTIYIIINLSYCVRARVQSQRSHVLIPEHQARGSTCSTCIHGRRDSPIDPNNSNSPMNHCAVSGFTFAHRAARLISLSFPIFFIPGRPPTFPDRRAYLSLSSYPSTSTVHLLNLHVASPFPGPSFPSSRMPNLCFFVLNARSSSADSPSLFRHSSALPRFSVRSFVFPAVAPSASLAPEAPQSLRHLLISLRTSGMRGLFIQERSPRRAGPA